MEGKYDPWDRFFSELDVDDVTFEMDFLEEVLEASLPFSARRYESWWGSASYYTKWTSYGFVASPDLKGERVRFRRRQSTRGRPTLDGDASKKASSNFGQIGRRLVLLGCVSQKRPRPAMAKDLYISPLWQKRRGYAEGIGMPWAILSAQHGMVMPDDVIEPYDRSLKSESPASRRGWAEGTLPAVIELCRSLNVTTVEVHAGKAYVENGLIGGLGRSGIHVLWPLRKKRIGEQLEWYDQQSAGYSLGHRPGESFPLATIGATETPIPSNDPPVLLQMVKTEGFSYRWPDAVEEFEHSWEGEVDWAGRRYRVKHGVGRRKVFGVERIHTVTWVNGAPTVEGVGADDYRISRALLSLIKYLDGSVVREFASIPPGYDSFEVVEFRVEIEAPYSRNGVAVKIRVDDVSGWVHHALLRRHGKGEGKSTKRLESSNPGVDTDGVLPPESLGSSEIQSDPLSADTKREIAERLVVFGESEAAEKVPGGPPDFAADAAASQLLVDDPFAFLVAVIADQGVKAERAWIIPMELIRRIGHLDPVRMLESRGGLSRLP